MIRKAVAAIIRKKEDHNQFLLVHKVMRMDGINGKEEIPGEWGFPQGGVLVDETDYSKAIMRELQEETGSDKYIIIKQFEKKLSFKFSSNLQEKMGFKGQQITFFLVEYYGDGLDLKSQTEEIDEVKFFTKEEVMQNLKHKNDREYFKDNCI